MKKQYTITLVNKFKRPYFYSNSDKMCINSDSTSYETNDLALCKQIVKDFLDVPETELTLDGIKKEFTDKSLANDIPEENLIAIQSYYNGRLALYKYVIEYINLKAKEKQTSPTVIEKRFDIPYEYNHFVINDSEGTYTEEQLEAYLKIEIKG